MTIFSTLTNNGYEEWKEPDGVLILAEDGSMDEDLLCFDKQWSLERTVSFMADCGLNWSTSHVTWTKNEASIDKVQRWKIITWC